MPTINKIQVLGLWFNNLTIPSLNQIVINRILKNKKTLIANHNLHSVFLFHFKSGFRETFDRAEFVIVDGMPLVFWAKFKGWAISRQNRVAFLDLKESFFTELNKIGASVFYLGGKDGVAQVAIDKLRIRFPRVRFACHHGFFETVGEENNRVLEMLAAENPKVLLVGMGMPRQEMWILDNFEGLPNAVILPCGAFFDYLAGEKKTPPRWLANFYLEWFYRFLCEPKRLFKRYFVEPVFLIPVFFKDLVSSIKLRDRN